ncbi:alpha/beta fold hydrolase [Kitasatospora sp. NPDC085464]|uniref:alpha/beta fold hydrolase n=1 Tax=Kitasatospora sp. NPDC085464 TaxID=3364063 RepID=UPI0037CAB29B
MASIKGGRKRLMAGAVAAATAGLALCAFTAPGSALGAGGAAGAGADAFGGRAKPTVVLEHGAFADGSSWNGVIAELRADGYPVVAAANPLRGPASDAAALRTVLDHIKGPKVLAGHSYGGTVISEAATDDPDVKALVYVSAFLPAPGETALELTNRYPGSTLPGALDPVTYRQGDGSTATDLYIKQDAFRPPGRRAPGSTSSSPGTRPPSRAGCSPRSCRWRLRRPCASPSRGRCAPSEPRRSRVPRVRRGGRTTGGADSHALSAPSSCPPLRPSPDPAPNRPGSGEEAVK